MIQCRRFIDSKSKTIKDHKRARLWCWQASRQACIGILTNLSWLSRNNFGCNHCMPCLMLPLWMASSKPKAALHSSAANEAMMDQSQWSFHSNSMSLPRIIIHGLCQFFHGSRLRKHPKWWLPPNSKSCWSLWRAMSCSKHCCIFSRSFGCTAPCRASSNALASLRRTWRHKEMPKSIMIPQEMMKHWNPKSWQDMLVESCIYINITI